MLHWPAAVADARGWSGLTSVPKELGGLANLQILTLYQNGAREQGVRVMPILDTQPPECV